MKSTYSKINNMNTKTIYMLIFTWILFITRILKAQPDIDLSPSDTLIIEQSSQQKSYLGIVFGRDLDFEKAQEMHYPYTYGAYVDEVEDNGPAAIAGIQEGDIITGFGSHKIWYNDYLFQIADNYNAGDNIPVILHRDGAVLKTNLVLSSRIEQKSSVTVIDEPEIKKEITIHTKKFTPVKNSEIGSIGWDFVFYAPDHLDLFNGFLENDLGYKTLLQNKNINDQSYPGLNLTGFHFQPSEQDGAIHKGFFWASNTWNRQKTILINSDDVTRNMDYEITYWGISLEKQTKVFNYVYLSAGLLAGEFTSKLKFYQSDPLDSWGDIGVQLSDKEYDYLNIEKKYWLVEPNISLMIPVLGDLGAQIKLGYFYGIPRASGWSTSLLDGERSIINSPNTSIGGYTLTFGPVLILD